MFCKGASSSHQQMSTLLNSISPSMRPEKKNVKVAAKMRKQLNYTGKMQLFLFFFIKNEGDLIRKPCSNETEMKMFYMRPNPLTTLKVALQNVRCKFLCTNIAFSSNRGRRVWINNDNSSEVPSKKDLIPKVRFHFTSEVKKVMFHLIQH